jgi:hypothetical protein
MKSRPRVHAVLGGETEGNSPVSPSCWMGQGRRGFETSDCGVEGHAYLAMEPKLQAAKVAGEIYVLPSPITDSGLNAPVFGILLRWQTVNRDRQVWPRISLYSNRSALASGEEFSLATNL